MRTPFFRFMLFGGTLLIGACQSNAVTEPPVKERPYQAVASSELESLAQLRVGQVNRFEFTKWSGPALPVWMFVPPDLDASRASIVFVMHGTKRDADRYLREWIDPAIENGFIVVAPEFSRSDFPGATFYNQGGVVDRDGNHRAEQQWAFSALEPLFDQVRDALKSSRSSYSLYGHSAGSQFVHRYLYFKPNARVDRYIAANAGWYTFPELHTPFPYGLQASEVNQATLDDVLGKTVYVLLGDQDNDPNHSSLRRTPEAMRQGPHRFARGQSFFSTAGEQAKTRNVTFAWQLVVVEGVAHSNGGMAATAATLIK